MSAELEREWWAFQLPEAVAWVPALSERAARNSLRRNCYKGAPVDEWPLVRKRVCTRAALRHSMERPGGG